MKTIGHLTELLNKKNNLIDELKEKNDLLEAEVKKERLWTEHILLNKKQVLPVPRLQIECINLDKWNDWEWRYGLVYRHLTGDIIYIPFGLTRCSGGRNNIKHPILDLPFREGNHIYSDKKSLNLPAFSIVEKMVIELGDNLQADYKRNLKE